MLGSLLVGTWRVEPQHDGINPATHDASTALQQQFFMSITTLYGAIIPSGPVQCGTRTVEIFSFTEGPPHARQH